MIYRMKNYFITSSRWISPCVQKRMGSSSLSTTDRRSRCAYWYNRLNERLRVPYRVHGFLYQWMHRQRTQYRYFSMNGNPPPTISEERKTKTAWDVRYRQLKEYKNQRGDCNVLVKSGELGIWVDTQRAQYKLWMKGEKSAMTEERTAKLNAIGFNWDRFATAWNARYEELKVFKAKNGNCNVPVKSGALGRWVHTQRVQYNRWMKGETSSMTEERVAKLNAIGFDWDALRAYWMSMYQELKAFHKEHGHCRIKVKSGELGTWKDNQRVQYRRWMRGEKSSMTEERKNKLEEIGLEWDVYTDWDDRYEELKIFYNKHGHFRVPHSLGPLCAWVYQQRYWYRQLQQGNPSRMMNIRFALLEKLGPDWESSLQKSEHKPGMSEVDNAEPFGDLLKRSKADSIIVCSQNVNHLALEKDNMKDDGLVRFLVEAPCDLMLLQEVGLRWSTLPEEDLWHARCIGTELENNYSHFSHNTNDQGADVRRQWGGTGAIAKNNHPMLRVIKSGEDSSGLGRWTWIRTEAVNGNVICFFSAYRPHKSSGSNGSVFSQHSNALVENKDLRDPIDAMMQDLTKSIKKSSRQGDHVCLGIDANKDVRYGRVHDELKRLGLKEAILDKHSDQIPPNTHIRNRNSIPIDGIWVSEGLDILQAGYLPFGEGPTSDHRLLWVEFMC